MAENIKMPVTSPICEALPPRLDTNNGKVGRSISKAMNRSALASMIKINDFPHSFCGNESDVRVFMRFLQISSVVARHNGLILSDGGQFVKIVFLIQIINSFLIECNKLIFLTLIPTFSDIIF
jgi:hypothetical protein